MYLFNVNKRNPRTRTKTPEQYLNKYLEFLLKINQRNSRTWCKICSKLTIKTPKQPQWQQPQFLFLYKCPTVFCYLFKVNTTAKSENCSKLIIKNHHDVITNVESNDNFRKNTNFIRKVYWPMWTMEVFSTARNVRVMKAPKWCLLPKNSHFKTINIVHEKH